MSPLSLLQDLTAKTADAVQQMSFQLSNEFSTLRLVTVAVEKGVQQMQSTLEQQTAIMLKVMSSCEEIKLGQAEIMHAILSTKAQTDVILETLNDDRTTDMNEHLSRLQRSMQYHLHDPSKAIPLAYHSDQEDLIRHFETLLLKQQYRQFSKQC